MTGKMPSNTATYLEEYNKPMVVREAPYTTPGPYQMVVRVKAVAVNPIDRMKQELGSMLYGHVKLPFVLGYDLAGEVHAIGSNVTRFKAGDRIVGMAIGMEKPVNNSVEGAFQQYAIVRTSLASAIPDNVTYEEACVLPLGLATAATGLFKKDRLGLKMPTSPRRASTGKTVLIWGGSTSVGVNAIQLAVAAGYDVITTCSPRNFDIVKKLGAVMAFDYNSRTVVQDIIAAFDGRVSAGALAIGARSTDMCMDILYRCKGERKIASATFPLPDPLPQTFTLPRVIFAMLSWTIVNFFKSRFRSTEHNFFVATEILFGDPVGKAIFEDFLPGALRAGEYVPAPEPQIVGDGLEHVQEAFDLLKKGVSAKKLVVRV